MNEKNITKVLAIIVVAIIVLAIFVGVVFNSEVIEEKIEPELFAQITVDSNSGVAPFEVPFKSSVLNAKGEVEYFWDFGDGISSKEINPKHTYEANGSYTVNLKVRDSDGQEKTDFVEILAKKNKAPNIGISINYNTIDRKFIPIIPKIIVYAGTQQQIINALYERNPMLLGEGQIECYAQVDDPEDDEIVSYHWSVTPDDGITRGGKIVEAEYLFNGSNIKIPELATWREGRYVIVLTVTDSVGNKANTSLEFQVDKSGKEMMRIQKINLLKNALNTWNIYLKSIFGATVAAIILKIMAENRFIAISIVILLLSKYILNLDIDDEELYNQINRYLEDHPAIKKLLQNTMEKIQDKLEKLKDTFPDKAETFDQIIDSIELILETLGLANKRPIIFDPYPLNNENHVDRNLSKVFITVNDPEEDPFNIRIHGDNISEQLLTDQFNNTFSAPLITPLPANKEIIWYVNASTTDGSKWTNATYKFTTFYE